MDVRDFGLTEKEFVSIEEAIESKVQYGSTFATLIIRIAREAGKKFEIEQNEGFIDFVKGLEEGKEKALEEKDNYRILAAKLVKLRKYLKGSKSFLPEEG